jgi:hypothetical protein
MKIRNRAISAHGLHFRLEAGWSLVKCYDIKVKKLCNVHQNIKPSQIHHCLSI